MLRSRRNTKSRVLPTTGIRISLRIISILIGLIVCGKVLTLQRPGLFRFPCESFHRREGAVIDATLPRTSKQAGSTTAVRWPRWCSTSTATRQSSPHGAASPSPKGNPRGDGRLERTEAAVGQEFWAILSPNWSFRNLRFRPHFHWSQAESFVHRIGFMELTDVDNFPER
jgi:hypothetical protein